VASIAQAFEIALAHHRAGRLELAEEIYRRILAMEPNHAASLHLLGLAAHQRGRHAQAVELIGRAIAIDPRQPHFHSNQGEAYRALGQIDTAVACYQRAIELAPKYAAAINNLGLARYAQGKLDEAAACYQRALRLQSDYVEVFNNLALVWQEQGKRAEAMACYERALQLQPNLPLAHNNLGTLWKEQGELERAEACYRRAVALQPDYVDAHYNLGVVCQEQGHVTEAAACYQRAIALNPRFLAAYTNLGNARQTQGRLDEALDWYRRAQAIQPDHAPTLSNLGNVYADLGELDESMGCFERALQLDPGSATIRSNRLVALQYMPQVTLASLQAAHAEYQQRLAASLRAAWRPQENASETARPLRLGFVSADLGCHPVGYLTIRVLEGLQRLGAAVVCYSDRMVADALAGRFRRAATEWHNVFGLSDEELAERIRADRIDVLFDLAGHTARNRLLVFARRPAPVQITWAGYVGTTGLEAMDYLLADRHHVPLEAEAYYCEQILRMPDGYVCFDAPADAPPVGPLPALAGRGVTLASFNNPAKITPPVVSVWAEILRRLPHARLLLKYRGLDSQAAGARLRGLFAAEAIAADRVEFLGWSPRAELLSLYNQVDLALDTFPYSGGLTTCEALWMGVPVVTWPGETFAGRHSLSHLSTVGVTETIAAGRDQYVELAVRLAEDVRHLAELRLGLRERMAASPLCDGRRFAENLLSLLHGLPPRPAPATL
jgi:predicted O-linked N-acetylglucosamine transferase (SPINDLY family)